MKKIKKMIKNTMAWATESDFRLFAVICEVCAVFFTVWACCSEVCFFWQEIVFLYALPFAVWAGEKVLVFMTGERAGSDTAYVKTDYAFEQKTEKN
jgi:hypothetical protein